MAIPRSKHTRSRKNKGRTHLFLKRAVFSLCGKCGKEIISHTLCSNCGFYKGKEVINVLEKLSKKDRKRREKEIKEQEREKPLSPEALSKK